MARRLRRQAIKRSMNETSPLLKEEEDALRKALYESLKDTKVTTSNSKDKSKVETQKKNKKISSSKKKSPESSKGNVNTNKKNRGMLSSSIFKSKKQVKKDEKHDASDSDDEPLAEMFNARKTSSMKSNGYNHPDHTDTAESPSGGRPDRVLQAQRKFAHSQPLSPFGLSGKQSTTVLSKRPYTEDFVKYLCLRGTSFLPLSLQSFANPCLPPSPLSSEDEIDVDPHFATGIFRPIQPALERTEIQSTSRTKEKGEWLRITDSGVVELVNSPSKKSQKSGSSSKKKTPKSKQQSTVKPPSAKRLRYDDKTTFNASPSKSKEEKSKSSLKNKMKHNPPVMNTLQSGEFLCPVILKPMESDFKSPVKYLMKCTDILTGYGIGVIVPPEAWRSPSTIDDDIRINTNIQHIHCLRNRVNAVTRALKCYQRHHERSSFVFDINNLPQIGGCEVDIVSLASAVELSGGLNKMKSIKKWLKVADHLKLPKTAQGKAAKLQDIYIKYILPYQSLSADEKNSIENEVNEDKTLDEDPKSILPEVKGRPSSLVSFHRVSCNTKEMYVDGSRSTKEIEANFWHIVNKGTQHVSVVNGDINVNQCGSSYHTSKSNKSDWSLPSLPLSNGSGLKFLGQSHYLTIPVLKFSSVFTTSGWKKSPCGCHLIDYLHSGADKIWYAVPSAFKSTFLDTMSSILSNKWQNDEEQNQMLINETLVSPQELLKNYCYISRNVQKEGTFIVLLPDVYYCCVSTGYSCSERVCYAPTTWLKDWLFKCDDKIIKKSKLPLDKMLLTAANEELNRKWPTPLATDVLSMLRKTQQMEQCLREEMHNWGVVTKPSQHLQTSPGQRLRRGISSSECVECSECNSLCQLSHVVIEESGKTMCLSDALKLKSTVSPNDLYVVASIQQADLDSTVAQLSDKLLHLENDETN